MTQEQIFIKLDFANAFNTMRRDVMLQAVYDTIPELYAFAHQSYSAESILQFGSFEIRSQLGPQQWDPLGPLLFCLPLQSVLRTLVSDFRVGYLDDISLGGNLDQIRIDLSTIANLELSMGLRLNRRKCEYLSDSQLTYEEFANFQRVDRGTLTLLGAPLFKGNALYLALQDHSDTQDLALKNLISLQAQGALILLRSCFGAPKLTYLLRSAPCWDHSMLETIDGQMRQGLERKINIRLNDTQWVQATLPIRYGGLGVRRVTMLASSAYLASAASTRSLRAAITDQEVWEDEFEKEILEARKSTLPGGGDATLTEQKTWDSPLIAIDKTLVWSSNNDPLDQARLLAVSAPHAGDWLLTAPIASCGLGLSNEAVRVAIGLRLGLNLCSPHQCQCGETTDPRGHHGLVCKQSRARASRHFAMNDIIWRF